MIESNALIRASAGTGKTYALATRFIRLMCEGGVKPEHIVALTFSRAAAQEIYTKILMLLCESAGYRHQLRALVDAQHLGTIATLDSFILRIVRNFPREMGFQNAVEVLDPTDESDAVDAAIAEVLARTDRSGEDIAEAYVTAKRGEHVRTCLGGISRILNAEGWRDFVVAHPDCADWTVASMCAALGVDLTSACPDLSILPFNEVGRRISPEEAFCDFVRAYDGTDGFIPDGKGAKELMYFFWDHPDATEYAYMFYRKPYVFKCGAAGAAAIRGAIRHMVNLYLRRQLEIVKAKIDLVLAVEGAYDRLTRRAGKLTFGDFTKYSAENEFSARGIAIRNVEFRFDLHFDHWALDEFQDTSELQWRCLRSLVRHAAEAGAAGEDRTVMVVGDIKQSIYTWRGASARPFEEIARWPAFAGGMRDLSESHRYGPNIADFVNRVFGRDNIDIPAWADGWIDHVSHQQPDAVRVVGTADDPLALLADEVTALWRRHAAVASDETVAVLVRSNEQGLSVAESLRARGLPVVWEGVNRVHDLPVVEAVLALLKLADHPEDTAAWRTVNDLFDVRRILLPECADAPAVSSAVSRLLTHQGLARTLRDFCRTLREGHGLAPDGLSCERLKALVERGVAFESRRSGGGNVDDFIRFLEKSVTRELAVSSDVIRVLTIHRAKGLGFDHVFVPLLEGERWNAAIDGPKISAPLYDGGAWVLGHLKRGCEQFNDRTRAAFTAMRLERMMESLRTYYVAFTRAKKSMCIVLPDDRATADPTKGLLMRDLVLRAIGNTLPWSRGEESPSFKAKSGMANSSRQLRLQTATPRLSIVRVSPSSATHGAAVYHKTADALFDRDFGTALERGIDVHRRYEAMEWASGDELAAMPTAFRPAFTKPSEDARVWREQGYELFANNRWETGQFDRVVFTKGRATIYDFKTNAVRREEDAAAFSERMRRTYAPQMAAYRAALVRLTGLAPERIACVLLLESTGTVVHI